MAIDGERFVEDGERVRIPACVRVIAVSLIVAACSPPSPGEDKTPGPPVRALDERAAIEVAQALDVVAPEFRSLVAARGLAELEEGRLGAPLRSALEHFASADPSVREQRVYADLGAAEGRAGWGQVCSANYEETVTAMRTRPPADRLGLIRSACDPATLRQLGDDGSAMAEPLALMLALIGHGALLRLGPVSAAELKILGALATSPRVMDGPRTP